VWDEGRCVYAHKPAGGNGGFKGCGTSVFIWTLEAQTEIKIAEADSPVARETAAA